MNKNEIGKMISLADDSYIEEMFTTRLYERKHRGSAWIAAAAAVVIAVGAAGIALNSSDSDKIITDIQEILTETETDTDTSALESVVTPQEWSYRTNNRDYFKAKPDDTAEFYYSLLENYIGFTSEGPEYRFAPEYLDGILRFERNDFLNIEGGLQCGKNGVPLYAEIRLFNDDTENLPMVHMVFYKENSPFSDFDKSLYAPQIYGDTELYGFDLSEKKDGSKLMACWRYGDTNYMFTSRGLGYDKFIKIISPYIEFYSKGDLNLMYRDYFTLDSFDLNSKGTVKYAPYTKGTSEMNNSSVFAGYVPDYTPLAGLHYLESSDNYKELSINGEVIYRLYDINYYEYRSYDGKEKSDIYLTYEWGKNPLSDRTNDYPVIPLDEITPEKLDEIMTEEGEREHHSFIIPVNDFTITVMATSEHGQLFEVIDAIRSQSGKTKQLTLAEANTNTPFAGYVPQASSIGGLNFVRAIQEDSVPLRLQLQYRGEENDFDKAYTEYVHLYYYNEREIGDRAVRPIVSLEDITVEKLEEIKYFGDSHETKHSFYVTVSDFFIRVEALCPSEKLIEFFEDMPRELDYINSSGTIMYNGQEFDRALLSKKTIEWIKRYNELSEEDQLMTNSVPHDLDILLNDYGDIAASETAPVETRAKADADPEMVMYDGREYRRSDLSEETLEWLDWYNSASKEEQDSVSYVPSELLTFLEYSF
ncbi:MAG: hypothetical protein K2K34_04200 [Oscillospiraceae bacterium]|nr:hypothetical protein [Oscillospiraceae bacterium]